MKIKQILLFIMIALLCIGNVHAQDNTGLNLDHSSGRRIGSYFHSQVTTGIGIGYQKISFFNSVYYDNVTGNAAAIKNKGGVEVAYFIHYTPVLFDLEGYYSTFDVSSNAFYPDFANKSVNWLGLGVYISYAPFLPDWGKISEIITPYIGLGYQTSSLRVEDGNKSSDSDSAKLIGSKGTSSPMWKGGLRINLGNFYIKGEYKQSLSLSEPTALNVFSITAGAKF